jgi:CheY-like chemotaxis protein/EAL domain-containing protein (putative c-di-GMP-specific phosphodiesterase class I)
VVVDSSLLAELGEVVDALDQSRKAGPTPPLLVITQASAIAEQLLGMTGSADAFMANADAAGVIRKLRDLQQSLSSTEPLRVLIVDDDRSQVVFCDSVLRRRGLTTLVATSSREAMQLVTTFRPDLILVDLYMPDIDGMALTARIREMPGTLLLPIVFISGEQDIGKRVCAINVGADDFLTKPIRPGHLIDVVVGRAKRARALRRQVLTSPAAATTGPLPRSSLAQRLRDLADRPAALLSVGLLQGDALIAKLPSLLRCEIEQALAGRIAARLKPGDAFGPWQELHFLVLVARSETSELRQLAQQLRHGIDVRPVVISRGQIKVQARIQVVAADPDPQRWLDQSLALWAQRGGATAGADEPNQGAGRDAGRVEPPPLLRAISHPELALCVAEYQPLILVRGAVTDQWQLRLRLRATPNQPANTLRNDVLDEARHAGTLATLDRLALRMALDASAVARGKGRSAWVQVEVDLATLIDPGFITYLEHECRSGDAGLTLDLDTDALIERLVEVRPVLERLRGLGIRICLRNFGLQKEALRLLQQINVDGVKLDTDLAMQASLAFTSLLAHVRDSGVPIQVEDVPDREAISKLWDIGVDYIQCELLRGYGPNLDFDFQPGVG